MPDYRTIKFVYNNLMGFDPWVGKFLVEGEEYELMYEETPKMTMPVPTGGYRIDDAGNLIQSTKIKITGNSYIDINRSTGETNRIDARYGTSLDRHDKAGRDLVAIIKSSIVVWTKLR
jgi:hypothetical protein